MKQCGLMICLLLPAFGFGQGGQELIGKAFPDPQVLQLVKKYDRPVILDFFSSYCSVCFKMLPKTKELQNRYANSMRFVLIGKDDDRIRGMYGTYEKRWALNFPVIFDSALCNRIVKEFYPFYVWMDRHGVVRAVTGSEEVDTANIARLISGKPVFARIKPAMSDPEVLADTGSFEERGALYQFTLEQRKPSQRLYIPSSIYEAGPSSFKVVGVRIDNLYNYAFHGYERWMPGDSLYGKAALKLVIDPEDSALIRIDRNRVYNLSLSWRDGELTYPGLQQKLQTELQNFFGYEAAVETRKMPCWYLYCTKEAGLKIRSSGGAKNIYVDHSQVRMVNMPVSELINLLYFEHQSAAPFIDATSFDFNIDLSFKAALLDIYDVQKALAGTGLQLVKGEKEMRVIVLKPKKKMLQQAGLLQH